MEAIGAKSGDESAAQLCKPDEKKNYHDVAPDDPSIDVPGNDGDTDQKRTGSFVDQRKGDVQQISTLYIKKKTVPSCRFGAGGFGLEDEDLTQVRLEVT
jgi:hypothetical protein